MCFSKTGMFQSMRGDFCRHARRKKGVGHTETNTVSESPLFAGFSRHSLNYMKLLHFLAGVEEFELAPGDTKARWNGRSGSWFTVAKVLVGSHTQYGFQTAMESSVKKPLGRRCLLNRTKFVAVRRSGENLVSNAINVMSTHFAVRPTAAISRKHWAFYSYNFDLG